MARSKKQIKKPAKSGLKRRFHDTDDEYEVDFYNVDVQIRKEIWVDRNGYAGRTPLFRSWPLPGTRAYEHSIDHVRYREKAHGTSRRKNPKDPGISGAWCDVEETKPEKKGWEAWKETEQESVQQPAGVHQFPEDIMDENGYEEHYWNITKRSDKTGC